MPGHGLPGDGRALVEYRAMLLGARDRMTKLVTGGRTEDEVVAAKPFAGYDTKFNATDEQRTHFIRVVYRALGGG